MKISRFLLASILLTSFIIPKKTVHGKLIVLIAIDGLRGDLLERYKPAFNHGFKKMFDEGMVFTNAYDNHAITVSHAGHVTLATGNLPRIHGIVDAAFYERRDGNLYFTDAFADSNYNVTGYPEMKSISEKKVLTPGLAEWVKKNDASSKIFCVGTGNISSALYCFHPGEDVFWYNLELGKYVTSTYFKDKVPGWITSFNEQQLPLYFEMSKAWKNIVPAEFLYLANKDDSYFEYYGTRQHVFPYIPSERVQKGNLYKSYITFTPFIDNATLALARQGINSLSMGQGTSTDYLSIVLSQIDNTNHDFGPSSLETFNVLLQMDIALGDFYDYLDKTVGIDNYVVAVSADHGFPEIPEQTLAKGLPAKRIMEKEIEDVLTEVKNIVTRSKDENHAKLEDNIKRYLKKQDFITDVYTSNQLNNEAISNDIFLELYKKSYRSDRVPRLPFFSLNTFQSEIAKQGMMIRLKENTMIDLDCVIHGSPYGYDRYIPLFFMGMGVKKGTSAAEVYSVDVAPTLAKLAGLPVTNYTDGKSLFK